MPDVLTIGGSDSSGRAGVQADLRVFAALGLRAGCAITAVTAQNTRGVSAVEPMSADLVTAQIESAAAELEIRATKIGMLATSAIAEAVAAAIEDLQLPLVVLDPVLASSSGTRLLDADGVQTLLIELLPKVFVITPNVPEAEALSGRHVHSVEDMRDAARRLHNMGAEHVVVKGGHLGEADDDVVDVLFDGRQFHELRVPRVRGVTARGTGCSFASALAAFLALGHTLPDASSRAQAHVAELIARTARL